MTSLQEMKLIKNKRRKREEEMKREGKNEE
jgi:hypothetical protein